MVSELADEPDWELIDVGYHPFVSRGCVSLVGSVLPFPSDSDTGGCTDFWEMGLNVLTVPLHDLFLSSNLVKSEVSLGVCPE